MPKLKLLLSLLIFSLFLSGCIAPMTPNPEKRKCNDQCLSSKEKCMMDAMDNHAVSQCDADLRNCIADNCSALPSYLEHHH